MREIPQISVLSSFAFHAKERDIFFKSAVSITHEQ